MAFHGKRSTFLNVWRQSSGTKYTWTLTSNVFKRFFEQEKMECYSKKELMSKFRYILYQPELWCQHFEATYFSCVSSQRLNFSTLFCGTSHVYFFLYFFRSLWIVMFYNLYLFCWIQNENLFVKKHVGLYQMLLLVTNNKYR